MQEGRELVPASKPADRVRNFVSTLFRGLTRKEPPRNTQEEEKKDQLMAQIVKKVQADMLQHGFRVTKRLERENVPTPRNLYMEGHFKKDTTIDYLVYTAKNGRNTVASTEVETDAWTDMGNMERILAEHNNTDSNTRSYGLGGHADTIKFKLEEDFFNQFRADEGYERNVWLRRDRARTHSLEDSDKTFGKDEFQDIRLFRVQMGDYSSRDRGLTTGESIEFFNEILNADINEKATQEKFKDVEREARKKPDFVSIKWNSGVQPPSQQISPNKRGLPEPRK